MARQRLTALAAATLSLALAGGVVHAAEPELEVIGESESVTVRASGDRTYVEFDYAEPLPGAAVTRTHRGRRIGEGCEYSGTLSAPGTETRVWTEREVSTDTETCTMVMEGAWISEADAETDDDDPDWEWDGHMRGEAVYFGIVEARTKSRMRWDTGPNCITAWLRTGSWYWIVGTWIRTGYWSSGSSTACGSGAWATVGRGTFGEYNGYDLCPPGSEPDLDDVGVSHDVTFTAKKAGGSSAAWTLREWGKDDYCQIFLANEHHFDPN